MKKLFSLVLALSMALALTACSGSADTDSTTDDTTETTAEPVELHVFAAASMQESLDQVIEAYKAVALSLIHISEPTRQAEISYAVFCLKKKKK